MEKFLSPFLNVRKQNPLVFSLTNFVTVNDCANIILAAGGSPIMSLDCREAAQLAQISSAVVINFGTPSPTAIEAMMIAGKAANKANIPLILDPVGVGATSLRSALAQDFLSELHFSAIRCNASEISALNGETFDGKGVDANVKNNDLSPLLKTVKSFANATSTIVAVSGAVDVVSDGRNTILIHNGVKKMREITGSGCMLSALSGTFLGANPTAILEAMTSSFITMGIAGEIAFTRLQPFEGNSTFRNYLIDAVNILDSKCWKEMAKYEII